MQHWEWDAAQMLAPGLQAPAEETVCVICTNPNGSAYRHTLCIIDVNPTSREYGEIVGEIPLDRADAPSGAESVSQDPAATPFRAVHEPAPEHGEQFEPCVLVAHDPACQSGFVSSGFSLRDLSSAISVWHRDDGLDAFRLRSLHQVIAIPDEPGGVETLPQVLQSHGAVPALITDMALSPDDCFLYVACWGSGQIKQFDVSDPHLPRETASVRIGGIAARAAHPAQVRRLNGGPATVTVSHDGRRLYVTNALSPYWEDLFYPNGLQGWMIKLDAGHGGIAIDPNFFVDFGERRPQRARLPEQRPW
jgi:hypothetical protein